MNHLTARTTHYWDAVYSMTDNYQNDRSPSAGWQYDADGRVLLSTEMGYSYDAAGNLISFGDITSGITEQQMDADELRARAEGKEFNEQTWAWETEKLAYVTSSVLGGAAVTEII